MDSQTMISNDDRPMTLAFKWKHGLGRPEAIAVLYAVDEGYRTADLLQAALPQLAPHRLESALRNLVEVKLIEIGPDQELALSPDALILDQLTIMSQIVVTLPASWSLQGFLPYLYARLGVMKPNLAIHVLQVEPEG